MEPSRSSPSEPVSRPSLRSTSPVAGPAPSDRTALRRAGNSPVQIHKAQLAEVVPVWYDLALRMKKDPDAEAAFGWIQEVQP